MCAARVRDELTYGADRVIMHGASPTELAPIVTAYNAAKGAQNTLAARSGGLTPLPLTS